MAVTIKDGVITDVGESTGEFKARMQAKRIKERGLSKTEQRQAERRGFTEKDYISYYESKTAEASKQRAQATIQSKIDPLIQAQPKGSIKTTLPSGEVVYRITGTSATGRYVTDVYQKVREKKIIQKTTDQYKSIPRSAKKVTTEEGTVYRTKVKSGDRTIVTDYDPGGVVETKVLSKTFIKGEKLFIPKPSKPKRFLPPTPSLDIAKKFKLTPEDIKKGPSTKLSKYAETLIKREERLTGLKESVFKKLHIKGKDTAKWYDIKEIGKGVARAPFEIASIPSFVFGRGQLVARSLFDPTGRRELARGFGKTPSAVREVFVHKDVLTGKYQFTAQNVVNVGLIALATRGVAKSPKNVGLRVYEKYAKTDIKGSIIAYQKTAVFKSAGKLKGRPYKETTVFRGKASTSTIIYRGKTYIVQRSATGKGSYRILSKRNVVLKKGKFKAGKKPIPLKAEKGVTTQDIQFLNQRPLSQTHLKYLEQLKTRAKADATFRAGKQPLKFKAQAKVKVKADVAGVVTHQRIKFQKVDYKAPTIKITDKYVKPKIQFAKAPKHRPDIVIEKYVKEGKAITGYKKGVIIQPRHILRGTKDVFVKGEFQITKGRGFGIIRKPTKIKPPKPVKTPKFPKPTKIKTAIEKPLIDSSKIPKSVYKSKPSPLSKQIALTEQVRAEAIIEIPFQAKAPSLKFTPVNFDIITVPLGKRPVPLVPIVKPSEKVTPLSITPPPQIIKPLFKVTPTKIKTFQEVRPTTVFGVKSVVEQIQEQKTIADIKTGLKGRAERIQEPKGIVEQVKAQATIQEQIQKQTQIAPQRGVFQNVFEKGVVTPTIAPQLRRFAIPKTSGFPKFDFGKALKPTGFDVFTRIKGVFKKANIKPLAKQDAINFGAYRVGTTSQATFKITEATGPVQDVFKGKGILEDFYKKDDLFIEKRGRRIKSIGELQEITFKGIQSRKTKNIFGGK